MNVITPKTMPLIGNILVIDDEPGSLKLLKDILNHEGFQVRPFTNGLLALRSIEVEYPEVILLDMCMPEISGLEVCRRLKANERTRHIPIIFISGLHDLEDKIKAFQAGGADYVTKPFQKEEVIARVKAHANLHRSLIEIKRIDEALRKSEAQLKIAQAIAHLGHWEWDMDSNQIELSEEVNRILGLEPSRQQLTYDDFTSHIHPDDRERVIEQMHHVVKQCNFVCTVCQEFNFECEYRIILPDGKQRVLQSKGQCLKSSGGQDRLKIFGTLQDETDEFARIKMLGIALDITRQKELEWQLEKQANTDFLTGCANRRYFMTQLNTEFERSLRYTYNLALLMLDLDFFKKINDNYGHSVGDLTLIKLVENCNKGLRSTDLIGRYGGEEFSILLPETSYSQAIEIAERLRKIIAAQEIILAEDVRVRFTASIGVACLKPSDISVDELIKRADQALYQAKSNGRNCICGEDM